jgi:hypothetical protein
MHRRTRDRAFLPVLDAINEEHVVALRACGLWSPTGDSAVDFMTKPRREGEQLLPMHPSIDHRGLQFRPLGRGLASVVLRPSWCSAMSAGGNCSRRLLRQFYGRTRAIHLAAVAARAGKLKARPARTSSTGRKPAATAIGPPAPVPPRYRLGLHDQQVPSLVSERAARQHPEAQVGVANSRPRLRAQHQQLLSQANVLHTKDARGLNQAAIPTRATEASPPPRSFSTSRSLLPDMAERRQWS